MTTQDSRQQLNDAISLIDQLSKQSPDKVEREIASEMMVVWYKSKEKLNTVQPQMDFTPNSKNQKNAK
jgi:hypothetical protein